MPPLVSTFDLRKPIGSEQESLLNSQLLDFLRLQGLHSS